MGAHRRSRTARPAPARFVLTRRTLRVLAIAGRGAVRVPDLARAEFPDLSTAHRTLAKLNGAGLIDVHAPNLNMSNIVTLRARGLAVLVDAGHDPGALHVVRRLGSGTNHLLTLNAVRLAFERDARRRPDVRLEDVRIDLDLRRALGHEARRADALIPDLVIGLTIAERGLGLLVEVDLGSESARVWQSKLRLIHERYAAGSAVAGLAPPWRPLLLARGTRLRMLARVTAAAGGGALWVGGELDAFIEDPYGPVLATVADIANAKSTVTYDLALAPAATPAVAAASTARAGAR